jgi:hypothetical protein
VAADATTEEIRHAYRRRAKENHPDLFPAEEWESRALRMVVLNEAYAVLTALAQHPELRHGQEPPTESPSPVRRPGPLEPTDVTTVGPHRDPGYAYYKQGFVNYSQAVDGIAALSDQPAARRQRMTQGPALRSARRFARSLSLLRIAHMYFSRVVADHPDSVWRPDAEYKLRRIERFTELYRKIIRNINADRPYEVDPG